MISLMPARLDPKAAAKFMVRHNLKPLVPYPGAMVKWKCRCMLCDATVAPRYNDIDQGQGGCKSCGTERAHEKLRLSDREARKAMRAAGLTPLEPYVNTGTPWHCRCNRCGAEVWPTRDHIMHGQGGCRGCGFRDGAAKHRHTNERATAEMRKRGFEPLEPYPGSASRWRCKHMKCGRTVSLKYAAVKHTGGGCLQCGFDATHDAQRLAHDRAAAVMEKAGLRPLEPYKSALAPWRCRCKKCRREVRPRYNSIQQGQGGCIYCANRSFIGARAVVYLLQHDRLDLAKIGIAKATSARIQNFVANGWRVLRTWDFEDGADALAAERSIKDWWKYELGAPVGATRRQMNGLFGHTETVPLAAVNLSQTKRRVTIAANAAASRRKPR